MTREERFATDTPRVSRYASASFNSFSVMLHVRRGDTGTDTIGNDKESLSRETRVRKRKARGRERERKRKGREKMRMRGVHGLEAVATKVS